MSEWQMTYVRVALRLYPRAGSDIVHTFLTSVTSTKIQIIRRCYKIKAPPPAFKISIQGSMSGGRGRQNKPGGMLSFLNRFPVCYSHFFFVQFHKTHKEKGKIKHTKRQRVLGLHRDLGGISHTGFAFKIKYDPATVN